jgi:outer membrane protein assembly factor BamB
VIRIRPGRSWRLNPAYVGELRSLSGARAKGFTGADILDVLGIEVDGVDITAGVGEARVLQAVDELSQALIRIGDGEAAAQATIGPGPTELVLEARGHDLLLTLLTLAPPARVLASGLLVDAQKMRAATLHAARGLLLDLLAVSAALSGAPLARRLGAQCAQLARRGQTRARPWPARTAEPQTLLSHVHRKPEKLSIQLPPETTSRLRGAPEVRFAPLAPHLGRGSVTLLRSSAPGLTWEGPVFLFLRNLLGDASRLVEAWESGEPAFQLQFGTHELRWDLTKDELRAQGWKRPLKLPPLRFATVAAGSAELYADETLRHGGDELAADLRDRAHALMRHCTDLESGDLRRAPAAVAAPPPREAKERRTPLARGRIRRLVYREVWGRPAEGILRALPLDAARLVLEGSEALAGLDAASGEELWRVSASPGALARGRELFCADGDAVLRLDATSGEVRWKRRLRGTRLPARLWTLPAGVLRALPEEGLALIGEAGTLTFRAKLPGGAPREVALISGVLVASLTSGSLAGLDPADGRVLWKRRLRAHALLPCGARVLTLAAGSLSCLDPESGKTVWDRQLSEGATELTVHDGAVTLLDAGQALSFSAADGAPRGHRRAAWARRLLAEEDGALIAVGRGGAAARLDGRKAWSLAAEGEGASFALLRRGVLLLQRDGTELYDAGEGLPVARLPAARDAALGDDLACVLLHEGAVSLHRLTTHLSLV